MGPKSCEACLCVALLCMCSPVAQCVDMGRCRRMCMCIDIDLTRRDCVWLWLVLSSFMVDLHTPSGESVPSRPPTDTSANPRPL